MQQNNDLKNMRSSYEQDQLLESNIDKNPFIQFANWFEQVIKSKIIDPNAIILATASKKGIPSARVILLKDYNETGFTFYTNYGSKKGKELTENPNASLLFWWKEFERQIRIEGMIKKISKKESLEYFNSRPLKSRYGALASNQSEIIESRKVLEKKFADLEKKFGDNPPMPKSWGGYKLLPYKFEFWQGRGNRLHDRICYEKVKNDWKIYRLSP